MKKLKEHYYRIFPVAKEVVLQPIPFWRVHKDLDEDPQILLKEIVLPMMAVVSIAVFFGEFFRSDYFRIGVALLWVIREMMLFAALYFGGIYITNEMVKRFGYEVEIKTLQKLVSYSLIPFQLVSTVTGFFPFFGFLDFIGMYGLYVYWLGGRKLFPFPKEKRDNYILKIMGVNWLLFAILSLILFKMLTGPE